MFHVCFLFKDPVAPAFIVYPVLGAHILISPLLKARGPLSALASSSLFSAAILGVLPVFKSSSPHNRGNRVMLFHTLTGAHRGRGEGGKERGREKTGMDLDVEFQVGKLWPIEGYAFLRSLTEETWTKNGSI